MSDGLTDGRKFRTFDGIDDDNREGLAIDMALSLPSGRVIRVLEQVIEWRDKPLVIIGQNILEYTDFISPTKQAGTKCLYRAV